jgi:hypothetical protein
VKRLGPPAPRRLIDTAQALARRLDHPHCHSVATLGLAKNAGKTTALRLLLAADPGELHGLLSIGIDGERADAFSLAAKPAIDVGAGTLVVTAEQALARGSARVDLLETLGATSVLGELVVCRVIEPGTVVLAGVRHRADARLAREALSRLGATRVLVDGAYDRLIAASPSIADGVIVATGVVAGSDLMAIVEATRHLVARLTTAMAGDRWWRGLPESSAAVRLDTGPRSLPWAGALSATRIEAADLADASALFHPGALSDRAVERLAALPRRAPTPLVVPDPSHLLASATSLRRLERAGWLLQVAARPRVLAVTVNPTSPEGRSLDAGRLVAAVAEPLPPGLLVLDPRTGWAVGLDDHDATASG